MATLDTNRPFAATGSKSAAPGLFTQLFAAFAAWNDARLTRKTLSSLSDRELEDIGLVRGDIEDLAGRF